MIKLEYITENIPDILTPNRLFPSWLLDLFLRVIGRPFAIIRLELEIFPPLLLALGPLVENPSQLDVLEVFALLASRLLQLCAQFGGMHRGFVGWGKYISTRMIETMAARTDLLGEHVPLEFW